MTIRTHTYAVVLCAFAFALVALLPHALQRKDAEFPFKGVEIMAADAEIHYTARMREVYDGFPKTGNTFYSELKDQPFMHPPFPEAVPAYVAKMLRTDPVATFVLYNGILAFVMFIMMAGALAALTGAKWESLLAVCALVFTGFLLGAPWDFGRFLAGEGAFEPLRFSRVINPLWSCTWFFASIWLVALWTRRRDTRLLLACVPCLAIQVYSYVYAWSFMAAALMLYTAWYALRRDWRRVLDLFLCGGLVAVIVVPYLLQVYEATHHPFYLVSAGRIGLVALHAPSLGIWPFIAVAVLLVARKRWGLMWPFIVCLVAGGIVAMNQQVLTGRSIVPHHYHWYFFHPVAALLTMTLVLQLASRFSWGGFKRTGVAILIAVAIVFGARYQELSYVTARTYWGEQQKLKPVLDYVGQNLRAGQVVYSPDIDVMDLVPVYTSADVYLATNSNNYIVSTERARTPFFFDLWVKGFTAEQAEKEFPTTMRARIGSAVHAIYFRELYGSYEAVPDEFVHETLAAYKAYLAMPDSEKISMYPISAVVLPDGTEETPAIKQLKALSTETFRAEGFAVRMMKSDF